MAAIRKAHGFLYWRNVGRRGRYASIFDIFVLESSKLRQARLIEHANMALAEFEQLALAQFPQHSIDMDRSEAESVREIVLGEGAFIAVTGDRADSLQTRPQFEEQMRRPRQSAAGRNRPLL